MAKLPNLLGLGLTKRNYNLRFSTALYRVLRFNPELYFGFDEEKYFTNSLKSTFSDAITHTRASTATYTDADGVLQTAEVNEPRIGNHVWDGSQWVNKGVLHESEARTNLILNSDTLEQKEVYVTDQEYTLSFNSGSQFKSEIMEDIAVNAVDVFVYDTSKDSDGGAWRTGALAQASSWYNEPLNTSTRGSRREFPAVAVIVAEERKVTIYDGDDPSLPMWMVFQVGTTKAMHPSSPAIAMINAQLVAGGNLYDANRIDFLGDRVGNSFASPSRAYLGNIAQRNDVLNYGAAGTASWFALSAIVSRTVNDVAMTVLPDAPIDPATGIQRVTIAVATDGGVSVIKDDGTVVDSAATYSQGYVAFGPSGRLYFVQTSSGNRVSSVSNYLTDGFTEDATYYVDTYTGRKPYLLSVSGVSRFEFEDVNNGGLVRVAEDTSDFARYMHSHTTSTYNTGWMNGSIKGAFLSDTDDADLVGGELVTNGTFDSDVSGWTDSSDAGGSISWNASGYMDIVNTTGTARATQVITTGLNKAFAITHHNPSTEDLATYWNNTSLGTLYSGETRTDFVVGTGATDTLSYRNFWAGTTLSVDNISIKLADADRSVNNNGLVVTGNITRSPVNSGADLVAYSGFSASNYLEQPYNPDLDFGTGDFCVMGWVKFSSTSIQQWFDRRQTSPTDGFTAWFGNGQLNFRSTDASVSSTTTSNAAVNNNTWRHIAAVVSSSGSLHSIYIDGVLDKEVSVTARDVDVSAPLTVGVTASLGSPFLGQLSLLRISATAPTAEQIAKIYNDEKVLFQENAQATLYGASDAVTALAHDPDTDLLHVGTSAGRSVFDGLRRVDNTTDAITTAISAVGGFIAEE